MRTRRRRRIVLVSLTAGLCGGLGLVASAIQGQDGDGIAARQGPEPPQRAAEAETTAPVRAARRRRGVLISVAELRSRPTRGAHWSRVVELAGRPLNPARKVIARNNDPFDDVLLAKAIAYARVPGTYRRYRREVARGIRSAIDSDRYARQSLPVARNVVGVVSAADLIRLHAYAPSLDRRFAAWLQAVRSRRAYGGRRLWPETIEYMGPSNWGAHAFASVAAINAYLDDRSSRYGNDELARRFLGYLGDRSAFAGFGRDDLDTGPWTGGYARSYVPAASYGAPRPINPPGARKRDQNGVVRNVDGVVVADQARNDDEAGLRKGVLRWPPPHRTEYYAIALQNATVAAEILHRHGYRRVFAVRARALRRAHEWVRRLDRRFGGWYSDYLISAQALGAIAAYRYGRRRYPVYPETGNVHGAAHTGYTHQGYAGY